MPARSNGPIKTPQQQEKLDAKENWHKLVVKILIWKDGSSINNNAHEKGRITDGEWKTYSKTIISTNTTLSKEKVAARLKELRETIQKNGGFE